MQPETFYHIYNHANGEENLFRSEENYHYFLRQWVHKVDKIPLNTISCRGWDKATSEPSEVNPTPDFTASIKLHKDKDGRFFITGSWHESNRDKDLEVNGKFRKRPGERDLCILNQAKSDGSDTHIVFPIDPGAGKVEYIESSKKLAEEGFVVKSDPMPNNKSKLTRFEPFASACENGLVSIVESSFGDKKTLEAFYKEMEAFDGERSTAHRKDDWPDALASSYNYLCRKKVIPKFELPTDSPSTPMADLRRDISI